MVVLATGLAPDEGITALEDLASARASFMERVRVEFRLAVERVPGYREAIAGAATRAIARHGPAVGSGWMHEAIRQLAGLPSATSAPSAVRGADGVAAMKDPEPWPTARTWAAWHDGFHWYRRWTVADLRRLMEPLDSAGVGPVPGRIPWARARDVAVLQTDTAERSVYLELGDRNGMHTYHVEPTDEVWRGWMPLGWYGIPVPARHHRHLTEALGRWADGTVLPEQREWIRSVLASHRAIDPDLPLPEGRLLVASGTEPRSTLRADAARILFRRGFAGLPGMGVVQDRAAVQEVVVKWLHWGQICHARIVVTEAGQGPEHPAVVKASPATITLWRGSDPPTTARGLAWLDNHGLQHVVPLDAALPRVRFDPDGVIAVFEPVRGDAAIGTRLPALPKSLTPLASPVPLPGTGGF